MMSMPSFFSVDDFNALLRAAEAEDDQADGGDLQQ